MCGGVAIFDYDNDGRMDIFFTNGAKLPELKRTDPSFYNCLLRNKGDGTFEDVTRKAGRRRRGPGLQLRSGGRRLRQRRLHGPFHRQHRSRMLSTTTTATGRLPTSPPAPAWTSSRRTR